MKIESGFYKTSSGREIYYEKTNHPSAEWMVFINGLTDGLDPWKKVCHFLKSKHNYLWVDLVGQGKSLEREINSASEFSYDISAFDQAEILKELCNELEIKTIKNLVGFSYGGGIATCFASLYPPRVDQLILFLPYIIRLDRAFPMQRFWAQQFKLVNSFPMVNPALQILERSYTKFLNHYMDLRYAGHVPDPDKRRAAVQLTQGIMNFTGFEVLHKLPEKSVHLITVDQDTLVPKSLYSEFWDRIPENKKLSWLRITDGEHLVIEQRPLFCAQWIDYVQSISSNSTSHKFTGETYRSWIQNQSSGQEFQMNQEAAWPSAL